VSTITLLSTVHDLATGFVMRPVLAQATHESPFGGAEQVKDLLNDRWLCSFAVAPLLHDEAAAVEAWCYSLRGMENVVPLWHFMRPAPRGTMRGSPVLALAASQGAESLAITTTPGATLLAGDLIGVGGQLHMVKADAVANGSGAMTVTLINRVRADRAGGSAVTWDKPTELFRATAVVPVSFRSSVTDVFELSFVSLPEEA